MTNPFKYFKTSPEIIRLAVMMYVRFPLSLGKLKTCYTSSASISATKQFALGGIASDQGTPIKRTMRSTSGGISGGFPGGPPVAREPGLRM